MGKAKKTTVGFKYYLGMHMGLFRGAIDALLEVRAGDRVAWSGYLAENSKFRIDKEDLFGGTKGEGGISGDVWLLLGGEKQVVPDVIKGWLGGLVPDFRGCTTMFFNGMITAMTPYPKPWKMKCFRAKAGWDGPTWYENKAQIDIVVYDKDGHPMTINCMNPAHIIYQAASDPQWGRGMPRSLIDDAAFRKAADTLYAEGLGACCAWLRTDTLDSFTQQIVDLIGATIYVDKRTGLFTIKLIRQDYDRESLPVYDVDHGLLSVNESSVSAGTETVNEVIVVFHDPITNSDSKVREQNLAAIQTNQVVYSKTSEYPACPTPQLAKRLARRDLIYSTLPLRVFSLTFDRRAWHVQPGDVVKIKDPTRGQGEVVVRVGSVEDGTLTDGKIVVSAVEDVFTMPLNGTTGIEPPAWREPDRVPKIARRRAFEIPYANLVRLFPKAVIQAVEFNDGYYGMAAEKPSDLTMAYELPTRPAGGQWVMGGAGDFVPVGVLSDKINYLDKELTIYDCTELFDAELPCAVMLKEECLLVTKMNTGVDGLSATLTVDRGVYDTIPQRHFGGELLWFYEENIGSDWREYVGGDVIEGKEVTWTTSGGKFPFDDAPTETVKMNWRYSRPYAPGRVLLNDNVRWYEGAKLNRAEPHLQVTWTHRDRISQSDQIIAHDVGDIGPEAGSSYLVKVYDETGTVIRTESGLQGNGWAYLWSQAIKDLGVDRGESTGKDYPLLIRLWSHRDGLDSWQYYDISLLVQDIALYIQSAQLAQNVVQTSDTENASGVSSANVATFAAQATDTDNVSGISSASVASMANQFTVFNQRVDAQVVEAPYMMLLHDGLPTNASRVIEMAARPTDRLTDGHDLWSAKTDDKTNPVEGFTNSGSQPWTPWLLSTGKLNYLDNTLTYSDTSLGDGVPPDIRPGDIAMIDREMIRIDEVASDHLTISRGVGDTIPDVHRANTPVWLVARSHGVDSKTYGDNDYVGIKIQPEVHTPLPVPLDDVPQINMQMAYRYNRPYPPGMMLANGLHWYEFIRAFKDANGTTVPQDVIFTWNHRNRLAQGETPVSHIEDGGEPEAGVKYQVKVCYTPPSKGSVKSKQVVMREAYVSGTSWTYPAEWVAEDGQRAGEAFKSCGSVTIYVQVYAIRDGVRSWQGYNMYVTLPSYACPIGQQPGGGNGGGSAGGNGGGSTGGGGSESGGGGKPNRPDPDNPDNPKPDPEPKPPVGPDPIDPTPDPEPEPEPTPEPTPDPVGSWGLHWDHDWAKTLPSTI